MKYLYSSVFPLDNNNWYYIHFSLNLLPYSFVFFFCYKFSRGIVSLTLVKISIRPLVTF